MTVKHTGLGVLIACSLGALGSAPTYAQPPWTGQNFLSDYSTLKQMPRSKDGSDFAYLAAGLEERIARQKYRSVMLDEPEVFIDAESPYKGIKPEDVAAISGLIRSTMTAALEERGYKMVDKPAPDTLYIRMAVTDLEIAKKKRNLLAYTPVGFVVNAGVKALQDFMDRYDILDMALQIEVQDPATRDVLAAGVIQRGESAGAKKPISFDVMVAVSNELGERAACRLDNGLVPAAQRIDCLDPVARKARPKVVGM